MATPTPTPDAKPKPEPEPEPDGATLEFNSVTIHARIEPHEDESTNAGTLHIDGSLFDEPAFSLQRPVDFGACMPEEVEPEIEEIYGNEEELLVDVRYSCVFGSTTVHLEREHVVVLVDVTTGEAGIAYEGTSNAHDNRRLAAVVDRREFYVEAGVLVVYRHSVAWCDRAGLKELLGDDAGCERAKRKLTPIERIPLRSVSVGPHP